MYFRAAFACSPVVHHGIRTTNEVVEAARCEVHTFDFYRILCPPPSPPRTPNDLRHTLGATHLPTAVRCIVWMRLVASAYLSRLPSATHAPEIARVWYTLDSWEVLNSFGVLQEGFLRM